MQIICRIAGCALVFTILFFFMFPSGAHADPPAFTDADLLALELSGELLPPPDLVEEIGSDLAAVRDWDAYFEEVHARPSWIPGVLGVILADDAWQEFEAGEYHGLDSLNTVYGPVEIEPIGFIHALVLTFTRIYNPEVLELVYRQADGVVWAEPDFLGGDGDDIRCAVLGRYLFRRGWGDCPAGCMFQYIWLFVVDGDQVTILTHYGDPLPDAPSGACCFIDASCVACAHWDCAGYWQGTGTSCDPNPCVATPVERESWGTIKARFQRAIR